VNVTEITTFAHSTQGRGYYPHPLYSGKGLLPSPPPTLLREGATTLTHSTQGRGYYPHPLYSGKGLIFNSRHKLSDCTE